MSSLVRFDDIRRPFGDPVNLHRPPETLLLGMPQLAMGGLSEQWLLKDCGHRHWLLLAESAGLAVPAFRDPSGAPIYAAFSGVTVDATGFTGCREHDLLTIDSRLVRLSRTRFVSHHRLTVRGHPVGSVTMTSVFVRRTAEGGNAQVIRTEVPGLPPAAPGAASDPDVAAHEDGLQPLKTTGPADPAAPSVTVHPCPALDFNGAEFLYFAAYIAFAERAEWALSRSTAERRLVHRRTAFHGNVDPSEALTIAITASTPTNLGFRIRTTIHQARTGRPLATIDVDRSAAASEV